MYHYDGRSGSRRFIARPTPPTVRVRSGPHLAEQREGGAVLHHVLGSKYLAHRCFCDEPAPGRPVAKCQPAQIVAAHDLTLFVRPHSPTVRGVLL